jgi:hypothetical protein
MVQTNKATGVRRQIRFRLDAPPRWKTDHKYLLSQSVGTDWTYVKIYDDEIWNSVVELLHGSRHPHQHGSACAHAGMADVKAIYRIENWNLYCKYVQFKKNMLSDLARFGVKVDQCKPCLGCRQQGMQTHVRNLASGFPFEADLNETLLFHGTSRCNADSIVQFGFHHFKSRRGLYGDGSYLASEFCKAHAYTCSCKPTRSCDCPGTRTVILAWVSVGDPYYTTTTLQGSRYPPERPARKNTPRGHFNSVVANPGVIKGHPKGHQSHQEIVLFEQAQAYPAFVVQYTVAG